MAARPIFYDTETTGIRPETDRVIELAAYDPLYDTVFEVLINPGIPIPKEASVIHHISDEMVAHAPPIQEVLPRFIDFCHGEVVLVAHNNDGFDLHFMRQEFKRSGLDFPSWRFFDTLKWARRFRPDLPRHTLQFLREVYGFEANNAHRALDDVRVLDKIYQAMTEDLSIEMAYALLNEKREIQFMPFGKHKGAPLKDVPSSYVQWLADTGAFDKSENEPLKAQFIQLGKVKSKAFV